MHLREDQTGSMRRGYVATRLCEVLESRGHHATFSPATGIVQATDAMGRTSRLHLDAKGLPSGVTTPLGRFSKLRCNDDGLITELLDPSGRQTALRYDDQRAPLLFARDGRDLARFAWNADYTQNTVEFWDGSRAHAAYSATGKPLRLTNRAGATEALTYDEQNRLTLLVDGGGHETRFSYDEEGRPASTHYSDGRVETAQYDEHGRWVGTLLNGAQLLEAETNAAHRPLAATYADGRKETFEYDAQGRLIGAEGPEGPLEFTYDEAGRPSSETSDGQTFKLEYDKTGLLTAIEYPGGLRATYDYDADKRLASVDWAGATWAFSRDREDKQLSVTFPNQLVAATHLAPSGRPTRVTTSDRRNHTIRFDTQYEYDQQDRLITRNDAELGVRQYLYDGESQLLGVAHGAGGLRETFAYDGAGNRVGTSGQSVVVDAGNRLLAQGETVCEYDERGNVVKISDRRATWKLEYDLKNQMTRAEGPSGVIELKYDAIGRRIEKKSAERTIRYSWCGEGLARETITTKTGESVREYLYRPASYEPLAVRIDGRCYFYHNDHLGTPQRITDEQGQVVWAADHFAFGYAQLKVSLIENPLRFAGQYEDSETGLHYNRFRYYSPVLGRYLSIDPLRLIPGNNLYLYVRNNPINKLDGMGLWSVMGIVGAVAVAAAVVVAAPFVLVAAPLIVAGGLLIAEAISVGRDFCFSCFLEGAGEAFLPGVALGAIFAVGLAVVAAVASAPVALVVGAVVGLYFAYEMLDQHFGWSGGTPFEELTPEQKSKAMGQLFGGTVGALLGGLGMGRLLGGPKGGPPIEESAGRTEGEGPAGEGRGGPEGKGKGIEKKPGRGKTVEEESEAKAGAGKPIESGLGPEVDARLNKSPTLQEDWADLTSNPDPADNCSIEMGEPGKGSRFIPGDPANGTPNKILLDPELASNPDNAASTVAHEIGHAKSPGANPPDPATSPDRATFVEDAARESLTEEGRATLKNGQARQEILDNGGPDIGFAGNRANAPLYDGVVQRVNKGELTPEQGAQEIGKIYDQGETVSGTDQSYGDYFRDWYGDQYDGY